MLKFKRCSKLATMADCDSMDRVVRQTRDQDFDFLKASKVWPSV